MQGNLCVTGADNCQGRTICGKATNSALATNLPRVGCLLVTHIEIDLTASHQQINVGENFRIEERAVQIALGVINAIAFTKRIEIVFFAPDVSDEQGQGYQ